MMQITSIATELFPRCLLPRETRCPSWKWPPHSRTEITYLLWRLFDI